MTEPLCFGNRPDADKKPECDNCEVILRCSILTLTQIAAVKKKSVFIAYDKEQFAREQNK